MVGRRRIDLPALPPGGCLGVSAAEQAARAEDAANPVDAFIGRKLKAAGFEAAPQADFRMLVKRAYYDLTGLPPTPYEIFHSALRGTRILPKHGVRYY